LHLLSGNLLMKTTPIVSEKAKSAVVLYKEKIPQEAVAAQQPLITEQVQQPMDLIEELQQVTEEPLAQAEENRFEVDVPQFAAPPPLAEGTYFEEAFAIPKVIRGQCYMVITHHG
jgi:hypothetical protein